MQHKDFSNFDWPNAKLRGRRLKNAIFQRMDLQNADFRGADLRGANFQKAYLYQADFRGAWLQGTDFQGAFLEGAKGIPAKVAKRLNICPAGDFIAWQKIQGGICKLLIPKEAKRSNATGRKCRAEFAVVLELPPGHEASKDWFENDTIYRVGEIVRPLKPFDEDWKNEHGSGIRFFLTREEAMSYSYALGFHV